MLARTYLLEADKTHHPARPSVFGAVRKKAIGGDHGAGGHYVDGPGGHAAGRELRGQGRLQDGRSRQAV